MRSRHDQVIAAWFCTLLLAAGTAEPAAARGRQAAPLHVLRIAAGPAGSQVNDVFVFTEQRSTFNRSDDREVIVAFDWEGAPGPHKLVAVWRSQDGSVSSMSAMEYTARGRRFGAYWRLTLSPSAPVLSTGLPLAI